MSATANHMENEDPRAERAAAEAARANVPDDPADRRLPELKEICGAVLLSSRQPVTVERFRQILQQAGERYGGAAKNYADASAADIEAAIASLRRDLDAAGTGIRVAAIAQGYRMESRPSCGPWVRTHLERGRPQRLSHPALETLAIIAYRQPVTRAEIEAVRGVAVDQILRNLLDLQLIRVAGRSDAPGRPWLFGTTQRFLEHFGLKSLDDLPGVDELRQREAGGAPSARPSPSAAGGAGETPPVAGDTAAPTETTP